jgi:Zn-dependent protease with chaperone function
MMLGLVLVLGFSAGATAADSSEKARKKDATRAPEEITRGYLARDYVLIGSPEIEAYLGQVLDKLLQAGPEPGGSRPQLLIHSADAFDAFVDVDDAVVVSTGTLRLLESEDELAALLGHELTHVLKRHVGKKSAVGRIPQLIESLSDVANTFDQAKAMADDKAGTTHRSTFAKDSLSTSDRAAIVWSDLLAPNWNRAQEREADRGGYDRMKAAGYDPAAFATLMQKLSDAQAQRSARMEQLRLRLVERAKARKVALAGNGAPAEINEILRATKDMASEKVINESFDAWSKANKDYDSPEQRQKLIASYEQAAGAEEGDKRPRSPAFRRTLREGSGGELLKDDAAALAAIKAYDAGDDTAAAGALAELLPPIPSPVKPKAAAAASNASGKKPTKPAATGTSSVVGVATPPKILPHRNPHLNYAIGRWLVVQERTEEAASLAAAWTQSSLAPARAFRWSAAQKADAGDWDGALSSLQEGRQRLDTGGPFLPDQVTYAKSSGTKTRAEGYVEECRKEDKRNRSVAGGLKAIALGSTGALHAICLQRLGYIPEGSGNSLKDVLSIFKSE